MTNKTYKNTIAGLFTVLYAFIITPTHLWHHHTFTDNHPTFATGKHPDAYASAYVSGNQYCECKVCAHKYSVFAYQEFVISLKAWETLTQKNGYYRFRFFFMPEPCFHNKGPPDIC